MSRRDVFAGLSEFLAVASAGSFSAAAAELRVTPAAVSQAVKALEGRLGAPLFLRTTRSVALTELGQRLRERLSPAATDIFEALSAARDTSGRPTGQLKLSVPRIALGLVILPVLTAFRQRYPEVAVEIDVNDASVDIVSGGFDAGVRIGQFIERDMAVVPLSEAFNWRVLGAPAYLSRHGVPKVPEDLIAHECIGYRFPTAGHVYRWQFKRRGRVFSIDVAGGIIINDHLTMIDLARQGLGLVYTADLVARQEIATKALVPVLEGFCPATQGLYLYYSSRHQMQPKLRAFIDCAREMLGSKDARRASRSG